LAVGILLIFDNHLFTYLACTHRRHVCKKIQKSWGATKHTEGFGCYEKAILKKKNNGGAFHKRITGNFMVYQDRLQTHLLQLFELP